MPDGVFSGKLTAKELIDRFHAAGAVVTCYTVDDPAIAEELSRLGVDRIIEKLYFKNN